MSRRTTNSNQTVNSDVQQDMAVKLTRCCAKQQQTHKRVLYTCTLASWAVSAVKTDGYINRM